MTGEELLQSLRGLEIELRSDRVQNFYKTRDEETRRRFVMLRQEVSTVLGELANRQLAAIAHQLENHSAEIEAGLADIQGKIDGLQKASDILDSLDRVIVLATRIATLAV